MTGFTAAPDITKSTGGGERWSPVNYEDQLRFTKKRALQQELSDEKEKKVRIAICMYALLSMTFCQMSRMSLNVSIVEMVHNSNDHPDRNQENSTEIDFDDGSCPYEAQPNINDDNSGSITELISNDHHDEVVNESAEVKLESEENFANNDSHETDLATTSLERMDTSAEQQVESDQSEVDLENIDNLAHNDFEPANDDSSSETVSGDDIETSPNSDEPLYPKFHWSIKQQNLLLGAFYMGYAPFMITGGILAQKYGSKYLILLSTGGTAIINFATPWLASFNFELFVVSRIVLGVTQAAVFPAIYDLFSKWLTMTETSVFAPLIKVAFSIGVLCGSLLPGVIISNGLGWPLVFYSSGAICFLWSLVWCFVSDSSPQESRFVRQAELDRIMRKKNLSPKPSSSGFEDQHNHLDLNGVNHRLATDNSLQVPGGQQQIRRPTSKKRPTPWLLILTSPSVLSLILVKFTYQLCMDFAAIELASYLKNAFHAPVKLISVITVFMFAIQTLLMVFVGILAKNMVRNKTFGWSKTTTRKVFQGMANFSMTLLYVLVSFSNCNITLVAILLQLVSFFWMFGAGGETMLPYDLSEKYPATIVGIAHSACGISGLVMALTTGQILGDRGNDNARWNLLLRLVAGCSFFGGLVFTLVAKAEPIEGKRTQKNLTATFAVKNESRTNNHDADVYYIPNSSAPGVVINLNDD